MKAKKDLLYVYADWEGLQEPALIGMLSCENESTYGFCFSKSWLQENSHLFLSSDLECWEGWQYTRDEGIFRMFRDIMPDRWGTLLMKRRELHEAEAENRATRHLTPFDFLSRIYDRGRMGGIRFKFEENGEFINDDPYLATPPFYRLQEILTASQEFEKSEERKELVEDKWLRQLVDPGSSLGGARPKANILDEKGNLCIAKFPSHTETEDTELWEHFANLMAAKYGIATAQTRLVETGRFHSMLSRRFDRTPTGRRIHFASAITLLGLKDGDGAKTGNGYVDIADFIIGNSAHPSSQLRELYRRIAFNICIGNSDDHFRNHGFLLKSGKWELSPAYDLNPTNGREQALLISRTSNAADLSVLLSASEDYMIPRSEARTIIESVQHALRDWRRTAGHLNIPRLEILRLERRLDEYSNYHFSTK